MLQKRLLVPGLATLLLGSVAAGAPGCSSPSSSADPADKGGATSNAAGGADGSGASDAQGGGDSPGTPSDGGVPGTAGSSSEAGAPGASTAGALPAGTFLYVKAITADSDALIARDFATGKERVVTDLRGDGSDGWEIWGHAISPDRKRIAVASLYGPTKADTDTKIATRNISTFDSEGGDFQRLTPVFPNTGAGRTNFSIDVQGPVFSADGGSIIYDFGNWWYEGTTLNGGSLPWLVSTQGDVPESFPTISSCSVIEPSVNPATGDVLFVHSVCINAADEGIFLYPSAGGTEPVKLIDRGYGAGEVDPSLEPASWVGDGSGFIFVADMQVTRGADTDTASSLLAFDMATGDIGVLIIPEPNTSVRNAAIAPDGSGIVYCLYHDDVYDLHAIDLTLDPPEDAAITDDGKSCSPVF